MISIHRTHRVTDDFGPELRAAWRSSETQLADLAAQLRVPMHSASQALFVMPQGIDSPRDGIGQFAAQMSPDEEVTYLTSPSADGNTSAAIVVPTRDSSPRNFHLAPFIDTHSRLIAWWLTTLWRSLDLAQSTWELTDAHRVISAAACSRALLETSAAFWCEAKDLADKWRDIKVRGISTDSALRDWRTLNDWIWQTTYGARFDSRTPDLATQWTSLERSNVQTFIDKLAQSCPDVDLHTPYQWLCNTVHPSCGGTFAMSTPLLPHASDTHAFAWYAPFPTYTESPAGETAERRVQESIAMCAIIAVRVLAQTLDDLLRIIDDMGLTTGAPKMASFKYWRQLQVATKRQGCPCRSGLSFEKCHHRWREPTTSITSSFHWNDLSPSNDGEDGPRASVTSL
jgi:hypothetical protein